MKKNSMIAMILAGGRGQRLNELTNKVAKPAVAFGGKYKIIDFPLSNCANSGIDVVGVLTQYESVLLNSYVAAGGRWGLDAKDSGVFVLPPRETIEKKNVSEYRGTADAITQNIDFIDNYDPEYVLILSGDHIYKMNYAKMLKYHKEQNADATIAVINVTRKEATRFGIMNVNEDMSIYEFEEKPAEPKSTLASMGIYIFNWKYLKRVLKADDRLPEGETQHDFGKNIIPTMVAEGKRLMAYQFEGYWKDVGTIDSLWEANMDLIGNKQNDRTSLNLNDRSWNIYTEDINVLPQYIGVDAEISNCYITQGATIYGKVSNSVIFSGVTVEKDAVVKDSVLMPYSRVEEGAKVSRIVLADETIIGKNQVVGSSDSEEIQLIAKNLKGEE